MSVLDIPERKTEKKKEFLTKRRKKQLEWALILLIIFGYAAAVMAQQQTGINDLNYQAQSEFQPTIKDAIKFSDVPEIKDTVKRLQNIKYGIISVPLFPKYQVQPIAQAKLQNEPLNKLYHSLLKVGYGPIYNMPYAEFWIGNTRSRETNYGAHLKHLSGTPHLEGVGYGGYSDNEVNLFAKQFYKKHTLSGDFNYERNVIHYYGYDTSLNKLENDFTRQRYQLFEPKLRLVSHYTDSTHINHDLGLSYYNLQNLYRETENNIKFNGNGSMFINKEKLNVNFLADYYNHKQANDTLNDLILSLNPSFEAGGSKWHADIGLTGTLDNFKNKTRFYFYPKLNVFYNVYENMVIPYAGVSGGLQKNSFRSLSKENMFVDTTLNYTNTNNKYNAFIGLRGNLSSKTSYDAKVSYAQYDSLQFFVINYSGINQVYNRFNIVYDNTTLLTVSGQLKYQLKEKFNVIAKGNYYLYKTKNLTRAYQKPDYDLTVSGIYNLQSKIIIKTDLFFVGQQWALSPITDASTGVNTFGPKQIKGWADINLGAEYRYSKMLSFFVQLNNIANQRYYRWDRYPSQRFNFMFGVTFVPF
ncbi:MAG: TonB-dependent receptor [Bacteroidetes bacterium]|nr:TonB-dependent receptor [Bacteroidota bacterium]